MITFEDFNNQLTKESVWIDAMKFIHKGKDINQAIKEAYGHLISDEDRVNNSELSDFKRLVNSWLTNKRFPKEIKAKRDLSNL